MHELTAIAYLEEGEVPVYATKETRDNQTSIREVIDRDQLPAEWRSWMIENKLLGGSKSEIILGLADAGFSGALAAAEFDALSEDPAFQAAARMVQRLEKLKSFLDMRHALSSLAYGAGSVERRSKVSEAEFLERYYSANKPVILTRLLAGTKARARWTPEYLAETCGDTTIQIMFGRQSDPDYEINCESHKREISMAEYVSMVMKGGASNDYYLVANNGFFSRPETQHLYSEVPLLPEYLDHTDCAHKVFLWFGSGGTITPLHHDVMNVMVAQIYGRKRFTLIPPEQTPYLYNNIGVYSEVNCDNPDYERHPLYREVAPINVVLGPGDVLFLPVGWWHYVRGLEVSIMVSYINFKFPNDFSWSNPDIRWH
jgi:hypothetical protein